MIASIKDISRGLKGELQLTLTLPSDLADEMIKLQDEKLDVTIKKYRNKRSNDANSLCWAICQDIARAMETPHTDREIYRMAIKNVGEYVPLPIKEVAADTFIANWGRQGIGWIAEVVDDSKLKGYKLVHAYYGSSTYTTLEMSRLLNWLVDEAKQMGIMLRASKEQIEEAKRRWGEKEGTSN